MTAGANSFRYAACRSSGDAGLRRAVTRRRTRWRGAARFVPSRSVGTCDGRALDVGLTGSGPRATPDLLRLGRQSHLLQDVPWLAGSTRAVPMPSPTLATDATLPRGCGSPNGRADGTDEFAVDGSSGL